ncbi:hypothetical protein [Algiphilus aromaticivorans]|jgi:hypothetical protein|uniref:hypothetical protein n=1 Tax=Algiphilus aromaticivorans TaxID=382454 RepID=UPI0005C18BAF|nr:hypothetical protein [Algiphilus aromaticivorans]
MSDSREDIRNLFQAQGLSGGYREFGERPTAPRPAVPVQPQPQQQTESEPKARRLDLVRSAPEKPQDTPPSPLKGLFERLAELDTHKTGVTKAADDAAAVDPMHMPLADLFELLESQGGRQ